MSVANTAIREGNCRPKQKDKTMTDVGGGEVERMHGGAEDATKAAKVARVLARMHRNANDPLNVFGEFERRFLAFNKAEVLRMAECEVETRHTTTVRILRASAEFVESTAGRSDTDVFAFLTSPEMVQTGLGGLLGPRGKAEIRVSVEGETSQVEVVDFDRQLMISYLTTDYNAAKRLDRRSQSARLEPLPSNYPHREKTYVEVRHSYPGPPISIPDDVGHSTHDFAVDYRHQDRPTPSTLGFVESTQRSTIERAVQAEKVDIASEEMFPGLPTGELAHDVVAESVWTTQGKHLAKHLAEEKATQGRSGQRAHSGQRADHRTNSSHRTNRSHRTNSGQLGQGRAVLRADHRPRLDISSNEQFPAL
jgi:hypothetical protein